MSSELPTTEDLNPQSPLTMLYGDASRVDSTERDTAVVFSADTTRADVRFEAKVQNPLLFREALSALYSVVVSDFRYKPKDRTAYAAYVRLKKESSHLAVWQAQQAYFSWLVRNDPGAAMILDPIITVHPQRLFFEVFSRDESTYANLSFDRSMFETTGEVVCGTTNVDFSQGLFDGIQQMRGYRETTIALGAQGAAVKNVAPGITSRAIEKKIQVPDSWLRGFLQVQSAATLPRDAFSMTPLDFYNAIRALRMKSDIKGKRRGIRIELVPGEQPRLILEPWETIVRTTGKAYSGSAARVIRIWGRRRLMLIRRILPYIDTIDVHLLGSGLPSFWVFRSPGIALTLGLSGFTSANWSAAVTFDLLLPRHAASEKSDEPVLKYLAQDKWSDSLEKIGAGTKLSGKKLLAAVQNGCQQGRLMVDIAHDQYCLRTLTGPAIDLDKLQFRNARERQAYEYLERRGAVEIASENRIPGAGLEIVGKVTASEDGRDYRPQLLLGDEGMVLKAECTCALFRKAGIRNGVCPHLLCLRLAHAKREAEKAAGMESQQTITIETKSFSRRDERGEEIVLVSLERVKVKMRWGRGEALRHQTLRFNTIDDARAAYLARVDDLNRQGYLMMTGD